MTPDEARALARERVQLEMRAIALATIAAPRLTLPDVFDEEFDRALDLYGRVERIAGALWAQGDDHSPGCGDAMCLKCYIDGEWDGLVAEMEAR